MRQNSRDSFLIAPRICGAILVIFILSLVAYAPAAAGERGDWFESLLTPEGESCCDMSDCTKTAAEWRGDRWWADVQGKWRTIPLDRILTEPYSIDGDAYVCSANPANDDSHQIDPFIYCFIPPTMGS
jgi:hypothetical protein